jgi:hypothetical protein
MMKTYMTRLFTVLMLAMVSMGAWADVDLQIAYGGFFKGGSITAKQDDPKDGKVTVYLTVTPKKGYTISKKDIIVVTTYELPSSDEIGSSRADAPQISEPIDLGDDPKDLSAERTYKVSIDDNLGLWVQKATFSSGRKADGDVEVTYHIINLGRLNIDGTLGSDRTEALQFTIADNVVGVPDKFKSPLAKNWKYYKSDEVNYDSDTKVCTFKSDPTLSEGNTVSGSTDIFVTYEMDKDAFGTVGLADGGIYNIKQGNLCMYQSMYQNVNNLNAYFQSAADPTESIYLWKFNIKDPYQVTIQTKSTSYDNYYLAGEENNFNNIRLKSSLAIAKSTKVWTFGLLSGGADGTYRLVVADGYVPTANIQTLDAFNHGYLNNADKARYQRYQGSTYKNCDLTFPALKRSYTFHMIDRSQRHAIQYTVSDQEVGKLSDYTDIPSAIRSPYLEGETMAFYSFTDDYSPEKITDENLITEMPLTDGAHIYVTYTNTHLNDKFLHLRGARALNVKIGGQYIYDDSGLNGESTDTNNSQSNHLWYFTGEDPYAVQIRNAGTNNYLCYTSPSTLSVAADPANKNFILLSGSAEGDNSTYEQMELVAATGDDNYYRVGYSESLNISTTATGNASVQVFTYPVEVNTQYYLIDRAGKLIAGPLPSSSSELALPQEWVSPLVSKYHYYKAATESSGTYTVNDADEISNPIESETGKIYVTYDVSDVIDITGGKNYMLKFLDGDSFNQEDGKDGINETATKAVYPYNNGDFHLYVYGQKQWDTQLANGASTRTRWLWKIISSRDGTLLTDVSNSTPGTTEDDVDPYHVIIKSNQNQLLKHKVGDVETLYPGSTYLRTYKPNEEVGVVTGVSYENAGYSEANSSVMSTARVNGAPTEYMILGTSLSEMTLKTFNPVDDGDGDTTNDVRQIVDCFEQYWKNNPTVQEIAGENPAVDDAKLTGKGWHTYQVWANAADWGPDAKTKTLANGNHWFQTISMGDGKFTLEAVDLQPQVILLDQHGWEIMRVPMTETEKLKKYDSPMVDKYHWYPTAAKTTGYHKYTISDPAPLIDIYTFGDDPATSEVKDVWYVGESVSYSSNSLADTPEANLSGYSAQDNKYKTDFYVTYTVKSDYANAYTGAASADATIPSAYYLKQGGNYAKVDGTTLKNPEAPADMENVPNNMLWYVKPNFDIDKEMGYKYAGETGAQGDALSKSATDAANYSEGRNGFDPYNVQIQSKAQSLYYFTANTSGSKLEGGAWQGSSDQVSLKNLNVKQTPTGYDQTTLNITNATFMVVGDANGNMRLMPRFDQQKVMQGFATFEVQAVAQPANDNGTHVQSLYLGRISSAKEISSSADITEMNGHYLLAENFTFDSNFKSLENFTGIIDGQLHVIRGTLNKPLIKTANGAIIKNVIFENVNVSSAVTFENNNNTETAIGAIACVAKGNTRIYNCGILATSSTVKTNDDGYTVITSCSSTVGGSAKYVGGLVGFLDGEARVINCFSYANITNGTNVGGIVGYNNVATTSSNLKTMVMNCMFYGDITGGSNKAPIYNGEIITNRGDNSGVGNYNYFWGDASYVQPEGVTYNCALMAETRYLQRFEFFRHLLNSHRELAGWWATGTYSKDEMAKWVLEPSQIGTSTPYPILKPSGYYPSVVNLDADNAEEFSNDPDIKKTQRNQGRKFGTLAVNINMGSGGAVYGQPKGAEITTSSLSLPIVDKDPDHFNFNYYKVQLPYYNDVGTKNYNGNRVVTGWKIVSINGGTPGKFTTGDDVTTDANGNITSTPYNFADRNCTNKDLYGTGGSNRIFNQGAYWDVPEGVTEITIEPYWAKCVYLADPNADKVYNTAMETGYDVPRVGGGQIYTNGNSYSIAGENQVVYTTMGNAISSSNSTGLYVGIVGDPNKQTVYDYAVVLVGNYHHYNNIEASKAKPYTITSIDLDGDNEPDYSYILRFNSRTECHPVRTDFINMPGLGMAQKSTGGTGSYNFGIMIPKGWFEGTNTSLFRFTQFEYENSARSETDALILQGGVMEQWVSYNQKGRSNKIPYIHVGGNVWFKEFHTGCHQDKNQSSGNNRFQPTKHSPISVTGGDFDEFYLTGLYVANAGLDNYADNAECYINGGRFGTVCGAAMEGIGNADGANNTGNIVWQIQNADIHEFYAGGLNAAKPVTGNLSTTITDSYVDIFCGGPKFGDMSDNKTVHTKATGCTFGTYFGAGYGGNSYSRYAPSNQNNVTNINWNNWLNGQYKQDYNATYGGVSTQFTYQFLPMSDNKTNCARILVDFVKFSLATTHDVSSTLTSCTITGNFYGGGSLGSVEGDVTSTLTDCEVSGSVFGAGFSASLPTVEVDAIGFETEPYYYTALGTYRTGVKYKDNDSYKPKTYTWKQGNSISIDKKKSILYTTEDLTSLGVVKGLATLNINGKTTVAGNVYGGGEESNVSGNTNVNICVVKNGDEYVAESGTVTIAGNVYGGGKGVADSFVCDKAMVGVVDSNDGNTDITQESVNKGTRVCIGNGTVNGAVYGGGEVGRVEWNTIVKIGLATGTSAPVIKKDVFGAGKGVEQYGYAALVRGNTFVTIQGDAKVGLSVYGGGEIASVGKYNIATAEYASSHPEVEEGEPYSLANSGSGYCNVTIQGNAEIGPNNMKMTSAGGPDDAGHVFGAGKGVLPYENEDDFNCQKEGHAGGKHPGRMKPGDIWECYDGNENAYLKFVETLALATQTNVTIDGNAFVKGSVYGGSMNGHVQHDTQVNIKGGQIGCGKNTNYRHVVDYPSVWDENFVLPANVDLECDSWPFEGDHLPYDIYKDSNGDGTPDFATDGHTFYGNVFGGGSGYYPYKRNPAYTTAMAELGYGDGLWHRKAGSVGGNTTVNITGGHILTSVYGGNEQTDVGTYIEENGVRTVLSGGKCTINMTGGTVGVPRTHEQMRNHPVTCYVFGAGKGDQRINFNTWTNVGSTEVNISGDARIYGSTFGGGEDGHVIGNAKTNIGGDVTITKADGTTEVKNYSNVIIGTRGTSGVDGNIFGGGRGFSETALTAGVVGGNVEVNISNGIMLGSVFGGGRLASVGTYFANANDERYGKMQADTETETHGHITVNISGGSIGAVDDDGNGNSVLRNSNFTIGDVFGGSKGSSNDARFGLAKNTTTTISGNAQINRSVFGGGEAGNVQGTVIVNIEGNSTIGEDVYGGGALADSNTANWNATLNDGAGGWAEGKSSETNTTTVNLTGGSIGGDAYGGGLGQKTGFNGGASDIEATVYGDITVNLGTTGTPANGDNPAVPGTATAFHISYDNSGTAEAPVQVIKSGRVFGTNNLNGSPMGNVTVNVYKTVAGTLEGSPNQRTTITREKGKIVSEADTHTYEVAAIYGGGNLADYTAAGKKATVTIYTCDVSVQDVYGGGNAAKVPATEVFVNNAWEIDHVFGGGNGKDKYKKGNDWIPNAGADVLGNATTLLTGGYIHEAYGGSNEKGTIGGTISFNTDADPTCDCLLDLRKIVSSGKNAEVWGDIITVLGCQPEAPVEEYIGGADNADVHGNVELTITSGTFGKVFGGNNIGGVIEGHIKVNIEETGCRPIVIGELYGCGNDAAYSVYGYKQENGELVPRTSMNDGTAANPPSTAYSGTQLYADPEVNVISCTSIGKVFGGGLGEHATVYGNPTVNINQTYGKAYTTGENPEYTATATTLGEIGDVFGGGNQANVVGNTTVNIGTVSKVQLHQSYDKTTGKYTMSADQDVVGANITGNVYGGGNKANVSGNTNVVIGKDGTTTTTP